MAGLPGARAGGFRIDNKRPGGVGTARAGIGLSRRVTRVFDRVNRSPDREARRATHVCEPGGAGFIL